jgi:hypothetical protein
MLTTAPTLVRCGGSNSVIGKVGSRSYEVWFNEAILPVTHYLLW